nr:hypothetical protein [Acetobacter syzygii]
MKAILILPNYEQETSISVAVFSNDEWKLSNYNDVISPLHLEKGCARGIPAPILKDLQNTFPERLEKFVLGQVLRKDKNTNIFIKSGIAGKDVGGRSVFLTALFVLPASLNCEETFQIPDGVLKILNDNSYYISSSEEVKYLTDAIEKINSPDFVSQNEIKKMEDNFRSYPEYRHFTSVPFSGKAYFVPDSEKKGGLFSEKKDSPFSKGQKIFSVTLGILFLSIMIFIIIHHVNHPTRG